MNVEKTLYSNFKSYSHFTNKNNQNGKNDSKKSTSQFIKPLIGSAIGVSAGILAYKKMPKTKFKTANEVSEMLLMAGGANVGGVLGGSIGKTKKQKDKKWKEAGFQLMNISIPMLMVSGVLETCKHVKKLNNNACKIVGSFAGMIAGAATATAITNATREENEPYRKYSIKDSVSNVDDIIATLKIGFNDILKYIPVDKILPFIYIYTGVRSGSKE